MIQALRLPPSMLRMAELDTGKTMASSPELNPSADSLRISATSSSVSLRRLSTARPAVASRSWQRLASFSAAARSLSAALACFFTSRAIRQFSLNTSRPRRSASAGLVRCAAQCLRASALWPCTLTPVVAWICAPQPGRAQTDTQFRMPLGVPSLRVYGALVARVQVVPVALAHCSPMVYASSVFMIEAYPFTHILSTNGHRRFSVGGVLQVLQLLQMGFFGGLAEGLRFVARTRKTMHVFCFNCFNLLQLECLKRIKRARFNCSTLGVVGPSEKGLPLLEQTGLPGAWSRNKVKNRRFCFNCFNRLEKASARASASNALKHANFCTLEKRADFCEVAG